MPSLFAPAPPPQTNLGRYRVLSPNAGVRVSPLVLGAMSIGDKWQDFGKARCFIWYGVSDTPAWIVSKANQYARDHGLTPFVVYQGAWNVMERSFERDIIPMAKAEGMALAPWNVLAAGKIRTDEEEERRRKTGEKGRMLLDPNWERNENEKKVCKGLEKVAKDIGAKSITSVAIAYVMQKTVYVFPIIGGRKVEHLLANIEALSISLSDEQIKYLESLVDFNPGFPTTMVGDGSEPNRLVTCGATMEKMPPPRPIRPEVKAAN